MAQKRPRAIKPLTKRRAWKALQAHYKVVRLLHLRDLFAGDPKRAEQFSIGAAGIQVDFSKHRITTETRALPGRNGSSSFASTANTPPGGSGAVCSTVSG